MNVTIVIENIVESIPFGLVDKLEYECTLGIDFLETFKITIDYGNHTWKLPTEPMHSFHQQETIEPVFSCNSHPYRLTILIYRTRKNFTDLITVPNPRTYR